MFDLFKKNAITEDLGFLQYVTNRIQSTIRGITSGGIFGVSPDGKRDYNVLFGHIEDPAYCDYVGYYKRSPIGNLVVNRIAKACWNEPPKILVDDKEILEEEIKELSRRGFFNALERADRINRIGAFSVLVIGTRDDGLPLDAPIGRSRNMESIYFRVYGENAILVAKWDNEPSSPRFNLPLIYQLTVIQSVESSTQLSTANAQSINVHWSRVVHLAEGALENELVGQSSLEPILNALTDMIKTTGGSSEAHFRNARPQTALTADKDINLDSSTEAAKKLQKNMKEFENGWGSFLRLQGITATKLNMTNISPRDAFDLSIEQVSGQTGIPVRILIGKGAGQLAGSEDRATVGGLILDRRNSLCSLWLLAGLKILSNAGLFDLPDNAEVKWEPSSPLTEKEEAEVAKIKADTLKVAGEAMANPKLSETDPNEILSHLGIDDFEIDDSDIDDTDANLSLDDMLEGEPSDEPAEPE